MPMHSPTKAVAKEITVVGTSAGRRLVSISRTTTRPVAPSTSSEVALKSPVAGFTTNSMPTNPTAIDSHRRQPTLCLNSTAAVTAMRNG